MRHSVYYIHQQRINQLHYVFTCVMFCHNSADEKSGEIASQSHQVHVYYSGMCKWEPLYLRSISHCHVDSTWFPFDKQHCSLLYRSWKHAAVELIFSTFYLTFGDGSTPFTMPDFSTHAIWELTGTSDWLSDWSRPICPVILFILHKWRRNIWHWHNYFGNNKGILRIQLLTPYNLQNCPSL